MFLNFQEHCNIYIYIYICIFTGVLGVYNPKLKSGICEIYRSSRSEVFLEKGVLKIFRKFTGEHSCRSVLSIKLLCNFIEIAFRMNFLLYICCIFAEHLFLRIPLGGCFWIYENQAYDNDSRWVFEYNIWKKFLTDLDTYHKTILTI